MYMCQSQSPNSSHPTPFPLGIHTFVLYVCLCFCFGNKIIYTNFLDSTYMRYCTILAFLFLTYFTLYDTL